MTYKYPSFPIGSNNKSVNPHKVLISADPSQKSKIVLFLLRKIVNELCYIGEIDEEQVEFNKFVPEDQVLISTDQSPIVTQYIEYLDKYIDKYIYNINPDKSRALRLTTMIELLGILGDPRAVKMLLYIKSRGHTNKFITRGGGDWDLLHAAVTALGMIGGNKAAKGLIVGYLSTYYNNNVFGAHADEERAFELIKQALQKIGGQSAKTLMQTLLDEPIKVQNIIAKAFGYWGSLHRDNETLTQALEAIAICSQINSQTLQAFADFQTFVM